MPKLNRDFYVRNHVVKIARELLGKVLVTKFNGKITSGIITETEAYNGVVDKASHAYGGRRTSRTEIMYSEGGVAYVYLCYGIHSLFNVVTNLKDVPHAVLIRAVQAESGIELMLKRRNKVRQDKSLSKGPGTVSQALGIHFSDSGTSLMQNKIWIEDAGIKIKSTDIKITPRIGVDYAGEDALLPYRFFVNEI